MNEIETGKFILDATDFQTDAQTGLLVIDCPRTQFDWSFSKDGFAIVPDRIIEGNGGAAYFFSVLPDTMYRHEPVQGATGRSLPVQETILAKSLLHTDIDLKRDSTLPLLSPPRENDGEQRTDFSLGLDESCYKILVAGHLAYSSGNPEMQPSLSMKIPRNNTKQCNVTFFCRMQNRNEYDELAWSPPVSVRLMLWKMSDGSNDSNYYESELVEQMWEEEGSTSIKNRIGSLSVWSAPYTEGLGYQYSISNGLSHSLKVYRETNWYDSRVYVFHLDLSAMSSEINSYFDSHPDDRICCKMKYADEKDSLGRFSWRGWTPTVGFKKNTPPSSPADLRIIANEA